MYYCIILIKDLLTLSSIGYIYIYIYIYIGVIYKNTLLSIYLLAIIPVYHKLLMF